MDRHDLAACGADDGLWDWNLITNRVDFSPRWIAMLGCGQHEVSSVPEEWFRRIHPDDFEEVQSAINAHFAGSRREFQHQHRMRHKDGTYLWMSCRGIIMRDADGQPIRMAGSHAGISAGTVADALTGLPNRLLLIDRIKRSIQQAQRHNDFMFALLFFDFDRFASLNERLGPAAGDRVLVAAARRLEKSLRTAPAAQEHLVARLEGDEFVVLLEGLTELSDAKAAADRLIREIAVPFQLDGHEAFVTASSGIALSATGYATPEEVLRDADAATHRAKSLGRGRCEVFDTALLQSAQAEARLEADLRDAFERQEFLVYYQPIVSLASSRIEGFEALVRWQHPVRGILLPPEFIPAAERAGLIVRLNRWVLQEACLQLKAWQESLELSKQLWVSVNFSGTQFTQHLRQDIRDVLSSVDLDPKCLVIELTEGAMLENPEAVRSLLIQLRVMGSRIALDDFGTGYSSLSHLRELPLDFMKIDRSFVLKLENSPESATIVRTITDLAHELHLHVIAEGIESTKQLELVKSLNCEYGQGFLFSRAVEAQVAAELLKAELVQRQERKTGREPGNQAATPGEPVATSADAASDLYDGDATDKRSGTRRAKIAPHAAVLASVVLVGAGAMVAGFRQMIALPPGLSSKATARRESGSMPTLQEESAGSNARGGESSSARHAEAPSTPVVQPSDLPGQKTRATSEVPSITTAGANGAPKPARTTRASQPISSTFEVFHQHVIGRCRGSLRVSGNELSYISEKAKDNFTLKQSEYSYALADERLVIKSNSKTYRFKSATAGNKEQNLTVLQAIVVALGGSSINRIPAAQK